MDTKAMRWWGRLVLGLLLALVFFLLRTDGHHLSPAMSTASPYLFSLEGWIARNVADKWLHRVRRLLPTQSLSREERQGQVEEFFLLQRQTRFFRRQVGELAISDPASEGSLDALGRQIAELLRRQDVLRNDVEETLEQALSAVFAEEGLHRGMGPLHAVFPPVDFRFDSLPRVLAISPRDRILLKETVLLEGGVKLEEMEQLEEILSQKQDLSALVVPISGFGAYPAIVAGTRDLRGTVELAAHEWLHQYWFFHPLGFHYFASPELTTLNETAADIAGRELGDLVFQRLTGTQSPPRVPSPQAEALEDEFGFDQEMRDTRRTVDSLLAQGRVREAETYMEVRRGVFAAHGYRIRKLNQAYFAFYGTYAESAASVSPIAGELHELRQSTATVGEFVRTVARFGRYSAFLAYLDEG